tara:strand:+ start:283 stop:1380 length:1098 start_codon:yes stop_codon:yes gene_type:complete
MTADRISLPQQFFDVTSASMLRAPLPAFLFARLIYAGAMGAELASEGMADKLSAFRSYAAQGVTPPSIEDQMLMLGAMPGSNAITVVRDFEKAGQGQTIRINRPIYTGGGYTESARIIGARGAVSVVPVDLTQGETSITVHLVAGPYDTVNSRVAPYAIDSAMMKRSVNDLAQLVGDNLYYDRTAYLDGIFSLLACNYANANVRPGAYATDAAMPTTGDVAMDLNTVWRAQKTLATANIPMFADGTYLLLLSPTQMMQLRTDVAQSGLSAFVAEKNPLFGDCEKIGKVRIVECNTLQTDTASVSGQTIQRGVMFGPGYLGYGVAQEAEVRASSDDNYGLQPKVIWSAYEGGGVLDSRFACGVRSI